MQSPAFLPPLVLPRTSQPSAKALSRPRFRVRTNTPHACEPPLFVADDAGFDFDALPLSAPLTPDERAAVLRALPRPIARFLIRRADEAYSPPPSASPSGDAAAARARRASSWLGKGGVDEDAWYRDYIRDDYGKIDQFGRPVETEEREVEDVYAERPRLDGLREGEVALFAGAPGDGTDTREQVGYGVAGVLVALIALKVILAFVQFFVSFTFSFLAIFALSAGVFVFFFLLRF